MSTNEIVDAVLRLLGVLISWPLVLLVVVIIVRRQLPDLIVDLTRRVRKAPGGFEFDQLKEQVDTVAERVKHIEEAVVFRPSDALTPDLKQQLQTSLSGFYEYFKTVGYEPDEDRPPEVTILSGSARYSGSKSATYLMDENLIAIGEKLAVDTDVAFREYTHHVLTSVTSDLRQWNDVYQAIESGLADYFPCSFNGNAVFGKQAGQVLGLPYLRNLDNERSFEDIKPTLEWNPQEAGETWGGAFWEIRKLLQQEETDRLLFSTWKVHSSADIHKDDPQVFVKQLLTEARHSGHGDEAATIQSIFLRRGLEV